MSSKPSVFFDIQAPSVAWESSRRDNFYLSPPGVSDDPRQAAEVWANLSGQPYAQQRTRNHEQSAAAAGYWEENSQNGLGALVINGGWYRSEQDFDFTSGGAMTIIAAIDVISFATGTSVVAKWSTTGANRLYQFGPARAWVNSDPLVNITDQRVQPGGVTGKQVIAMRWDGSVPELHMYRNSNVILGSAVSAATTTGATTTLPTLGARNDPTGSGIFDGKIFEVAIYNSIITETTLQAIIDALNAKWALF